MTRHACSNLAYTISPDRLIAAQKQYDLSWLWLQKLLLTATTPTVLLTDLLSKFKVFTEPHPVMKHVALSWRTSSLGLRLAGPAGELQRLTCVLQPAD